MLRQAQQARQEQETTRQTLPAPTNDDELKAALRDTLGLTVPDAQVCAGHVSPFRALADAYFRRAPVAIWKASRGLAGKSVLLAALAELKAVYLGASVNLLGGSGEQAQRVHSYMTGEDTNLPHTFWGAPGAPRYLLMNDPTQKETRLINGGRIRVLLASQTSIRGPHPNVLLCDESDEMELALLDAALGQPLPSRGIEEQTVISSTHHHAAGTMTEVLRRASERGWPVYEWCFKESSAAGGWLTPEAIASKRGTVTAVMWDVEYELGVPDPTGLAFAAGCIERMFVKALGECPGAANVYYEFEPPDPDGSYAHGADWARSQDWTIILTLRIDCDPWRVVAFERTGRLDWPIMIGKLDKRMDRFGGAASHDGTGLGSVVAGYLEHPAEAEVLVGKNRAMLLSDYVTAVEGGEIVSPLIMYAEAEHRYARQTDLYGDGHLPDTICAGALAYRAARKGSIMDFYKRQAAALKAKKEKEKEKTHA